jgi:phospho-N-acetylmuramoyl-pentapeptide-transferase
MLIDIIIAAAISFGVAVGVAPIFIPFLRKVKFGQSVRREGPQTHLKKQGTPVMGGLIFLLAISLACIIYIPRYSDVLPVLLGMLGFGLVGFLDDYIKVVKKNPEGLKPKAKLLGQAIITGAFAYYMLGIAEMGTSVLMPFGNEIALGIFFVPILFIVVLGTDNGVNFTDGVDGLCSSITIIVALFFTVIAYKTNNDIAPITAAVAAALIGFLIFNAHPAKVFMGDTGSLALGGFVAMSAYMLKMPLFIPLVGIIYLTELISVVIQVLYYKKTGKRIFKMAPIHHHFELLGWSETKVVIIFSLVTLLGCIIAYFAV